MEEGNRNYRFVKNFKLISAETVGQKIIIKLKHPGTYEKASFHFWPSHACKESYPPQCQGTVLRIDQGPSVAEWTTSTLEIWPEKIYPYPRPISIEIIGPQTTLRVSY